MLAHDGLGLLVGGARLEEAQAEALFESILSGRMDDAQIAAVLSLIQARGPGVAEVAGAARAMRRHVAPVALPPEIGVPSVVIDTCGTGGAPKTFNVSTCAAIVAAAASPHRGGGNVRVLVAKHGNRSRTGRGSAEVLAKLGVNIDAPAAVLTRCLGEAGVCFCFAIHHHPAMRHAAAARKSLGFPTIFNLLGPLTNPAGARRQVIGVYNAGLARVIGGALGRLGAERAMVVAADDGSDEFMPGVAADVWHVDAGGVRQERLEPGDFRLGPSPRWAARSMPGAGDAPAGGSTTGTTATELIAGDLDDAARIFRGVLANRPGPAADAVAVNAAAALRVAGVAKDWPEGVAMARAAIASGTAAGVLDALVRVSNGGA